MRSANGDEWQELINRQILEMVALFSAQDHSGHSASYAAKALELLLRFERLGPLTGDNDEWMEVYENLQQNRRCSHVFRDNGRAYDALAVVFRRPNGACYTTAQSHRDVTFPYTPKSELIDVGEDWGDDDAREMDE